MAEEIHHADGRMEHPSVRHERSDASFGWVLGLIIGAVVLGVIIHVAIRAFLDRSVSAMAAARGSRFPLASGASRTLPPEPRLEQLDRLADIISSNVKVREQARLDLLNSLGAAQEKGFVHIPIKRTMQLLADKLPTRGAGVAGLGIAGVGAVALVSASAGQGPLLAACALFPGRSRLEEDSFRRRDNGLLNGGASNSGRLFKMKGERGVANGLIN